MTRKHRKFAVLCAALLASGVAGKAALGPAINTGGVVPIYSSATTIEAGEWVSIYGTNLAASTQLWAGDFPTSLGGTSVTVDGKPAYLWFVSPGQINFQMPDDTALGTVQVVVKTQNGTANGTAQANVTLGKFAPSFCLLSDNQHVSGIILRSDGSGVYGGGTYDILGPSGTSLGYRTVAAKAGDSVVIFGTGFGPTSPAVKSGQIYSGAAATTDAVTLVINGQTVIPGFAGLSGAGLYQFNFTMPAAGNGDLSLQGSVGGVQTPTGALFSAQGAPASAPQLKSLALSASQVTGGQSVQGTVTLTSPATGSGAVVTLAIVGGTAASVPATVTVPSGSASATFQITIGTVTSPQSMLVSASYLGQTSSSALIVTPSSTAPKFNELLAAPMLFQPSGAASCQLALEMTPNNGNTTYTAVVPSTTFSNGTVSGLTYTFNGVQSGYNAFVCGSNVLLISSGSLSFTLVPDPTYLGLIGSLSGTMSVTGTTVGGGGSVTLSGPISAAQWGTE